MTLELQPTLRLRSWPLGRLQRSPQVSQSPLVKWRRDDQPSQAKMLWAEAEARPLSQSPGSGAASSAAASSADPPETIYKESLKADWQARNAAAAQALRKDKGSPLPSGTQRGRARRPNPAEPTASSLRNIWSI